MDSGGRKLVKLSFPCGHDLQGSESSTNGRDKKLRISTGACGVDCSVCRLHVTGHCSHCGPGNSAAGKEKLAAQERLFHQGCPILACAVSRSIAYCMRDCENFPCENFSAGPYPYSQGFLDMQQRRRQAAAETAAAMPETAVHFWQELAEKPPREVCRNSGAEMTEDGGYLLKCLNETWLIEGNEKRIIKKEGTFGGEWDRQIPFLLLVYLVTSQEGPVSGEFISPRSLVVGANPFQGRYELETKDLIQVFGHDGNAFSEAAKKLGGVLFEGGDTAVRIQVFPKLIFEYLLWLGDDEFPASVTILLDRDILTHYPVDALIMTINLLSMRLISDGGNFS